MIKLRLVILFSLFVTCSSNAETLLFNINGKTLKQDKVVSFSAISFEADRITGVYANPPSDKSYSESIDGQGAHLLPGLIDAHGHVLNYGQALNNVDLVGTSSVKDAQARIKKFISHNSDESGWIIGRGWNQELWPTKQFPNASDLKKFGERAIAFSRIDGHALWVNEKALELAGIDGTTANPDGGEIIRDGNGKATGVLIDNAMNLVFNVMPKLTMELRKKRLLQSMNQLASLGLTSVHDAGVDPATVAAYKELHSEDKMPIRVYVMLDVTAPGYEALLNKGPFIAEDGMLVIRSVKISADGALGSRGAALHQDYSDSPGQTGLLLHTPPKLSAHIGKAMGAGFQVNTHAIGDRANTLVFDGYEDWIKKTQKGHLRHRVEHAQVIRPEELGRMSELNLIASMQPTHATSDKNMAENRLGSVRIKGAYAWQTLLDKNTIIAGGSDFPVEPAEPLFGLHAAVTRQDRNNQPLGGWYMNEGVSREAALKMFTLDAAYSAHQEQQIGSIEVGKQADFILLEQDYFSVKSEAIWDMNILQTWVAGKRIYKN